MIFVSYSRADIGIVRPLVDDLSRRGVECWLDESNIPVGQAFVRRLGEALQESNGLLLVDTPASRLSYWVARERTTGCRYRREGLYHTVVRVFSPDCAREESSRWDRSFPLDQGTNEHLTEFLIQQGESPGSRRSAKQRPVGVIIEGNYLGQPHNWIGRQDELRTLDNWWLSATPGVWLAGLGGIGKSGLIQTWVTALEYLGYEMPVFAMVLYVTGRDVAEIHRAAELFSTWTKEDRHLGKLLVLDGYDEAPARTAVDSLLGEAIRRGARALVTSRTLPPRPLADCFMSMRLGTMSQRDAVATLAQFGITGPEGRRVAEELGAHPLALLLFSRHVVVKNRSAAEMLDELNRTRAELESDTLGTGRSIRGALSNSIRTLSPAARSLLQELCMGADATYVLSGQLNPATVDDPLRELAQAGLVQVDRFDSPTTLSIHDLVRAFVREELGSQQERSSDGVT